MIYRLGPRPIGYGCQRSIGTLGMIEGLTTLIGHLPLKASTISLPTLLLEAGLILEVPEAAVRRGSGGCPLVTWDRTRWRRCGLAELHPGVPDWAHEISEVGVLQENQRLESEDPAFSADCQDLPQWTTSFSNRFRIVGIILTYWFKIFLRSFT